MDKFSKTVNWICGFNNNLIDRNGIEKLQLPTIISGIPKITDQNRKKIILIQQFFIHKDKKRQKELVETLIMNVHNKNIDEIHLLNERIYTYEELGSNSTKIKQVVDSGKRLTFSDVMKYSMDNLNNSIVVLSNSDIFFDKSINKCRCMDLTESMICLSRYKLRGKNLENASVEIFNGWSQDTWIWLSETLFTDKELKKCNFNLGKPGCDNRIAFLASEMGLSVYNIPNIIKSYHHHATEIRNYTRNDRVEPPRYLALLPPINSPCSITTFLPANDIEYISRCFSKKTTLSIVNAKSEDMILLRRGFLSLNDTTLSVSVNDIKRFIIDCNFILIDIPYRLYYHNMVNICNEFTVNTKWLEAKHKMLDYRCFDWCISKRKNFIVKSNKTVIIASNREKLLQSRIDSGNCNFTNNVVIINTDVRDVNASLSKIKSIHNKDSILLLDTGADLIFGTLLYKANIPSISMGLSLNSYFNIVDKNHISMLPDAYEIEANDTWITI